MVEKPADPILKIIDTVLRWALPAISAFAYSYALQIEAQKNEISSFEEQTIKEMSSFREQSQGTHF